ncbi:hypothetical protein Glove_140g138 [Diversispora epigaea]|uniref:MARVEL domain-containing protein n=1 Tax=Diversispora epigaea TaxID=1348612 RepID=A0A397IXR4_9GLOM|nr:hypothetical protein Glove_140g138 [Diversispora epigaea]
MKIYERKINWVRLRIFQFVLTLVILSLEAIQFSTFIRMINYLIQDRISWSIYFVHDGTYNGQVKIWCFIVIGLTIITTGFSLIRFGDIWTKGPKIWSSIDIFLFLLWISSDLANMYPVYEGQSLKCDAEGYDKPSQLYYLIWCHSYLASIIIGWLNTISFIISIILSGIIFFEKKLDFDNMDYLTSLNNTNDINNISNTNNTNNTNNINNTNNTNYINNNNNDNDRIEIYIEGEGEDEHLEYLRDEDENGYELEYLQMRPVRVH